MAGEQGVVGGQLCLPDTDNSHTAFFEVGSNLTADRIYTFAFGDAPRTITITGNPTLVEGTMVETTDARLSDARTPTAHTHAAGDLASGTVSVVRGGTNSGTASGARTNLGLAIGTDIQAYDAGLLSIAALTTEADRLIYTTASDTYAVATLTAAGRALIDDASAAAQRTTLGVAIGTDVQADLDVMSQVDAEAGTATDERIVTAQRMKQAIDSLGSAGLVLISSQVASASSSIDFTSAHITSTYAMYLFLFENVHPATTAVDFHGLVSNDGGSTWEADASEYRYAAKHRHSSGSDTNLDSSGDTKILWNAATISNSTAQGVSGHLYMSGAATSGFYALFTGVLSYRDAAGRLNGGWVNAEHSTAEVVNGVQFKFSSGNMTGGRITCYGVKHA